MKKIITLGLALVAGIVGAMAQSRPTPEMMKEFRQTIQKRDISQRHLESNIPLASVINTPKTPKALPTDRIWFPGEWEEVQAIVVTCYYDYQPLESQGSGYWMADPLVSGMADYYKYSAGGWTKQGHGPYKATLDSASTFGKTFFYLMDAIQLGGAQAWVRVETASDSNIVLRTLTRMNLRHDNIRFIIGSGNSFWYRDCGPICFYYGDQDSVAMLDFGYYPGRALDDSLPSHIHHQMNIPNYLTEIEWEGGNCLVDGAGMVFSSDAIYSNNMDRYGQLSWDGHNYNTINYTQKTALTRNEVTAAMRALIGQRATHILPTYQYDGGTGHIDLYADMWDENGFVFSKMPSNYSSWTDYATGVRNIDSLCSYKSIFNTNYTASYIPFPSTDMGGNFSSQNQYDQQYTRTYSNHTFVNNVIMQPVFSAVVNGLPTAAWDLANYRQIEAAYPGYTLYPIDVREFDGSGGAIHCITKQIPAASPIRILHKNIHGTVNSSMANVPVSAIITNNAGIESAQCIYRVDGGAWQTINLTANGNKFSATMPIANGGYEYYISATNTNGKTITKPMTAAQGGYFTFEVNGTATVDSSAFDFDTNAVSNEDITFLFSSQWTHEDHSEPYNAIEDVNADQNFGLFYPNPSSTEAHININLENNDTYSVRIIDMSGRTIHTSSLQAAGNIVYTINASKLAKGIYNVVFSSKNANIVRRLIVE